MKVNELIFLFYRDRKDMVKLLLNLKCNSVFRDPLTKKITLHDIHGQTALFWIITNIPESVNFKFSLKITPSRS